MSPPSTGDGLHPPPGLARPPGVIKPGVPSANASGWWHSVWDVVSFVPNSAIGAVEASGITSGITSVVAGTVHGASHIVQGAVNTLDAVEGGIQTTGRLIPFLVVGVVGLYAMNEFGTPGASKRRRLDDRE